MAEEDKTDTATKDEVKTTSPSDNTAKEEKTIQSLLSESVTELPSIDFSGISVTPHDYQKLIESLRQENDIDVIFNARLGTYNMYGEYVIDKNVRQELLDMPKFIYSTTYDADNNLTIYGVRATLPVFGDILFELTVAEDEAIFYLVEEIHRQEVDYVEIAKEKIDIVPLDPDNKLPVEYIFQMYNIFREKFDDEDEIRFSCDNILVRKIYLSMLAKALLGKEDIAGNDVVGQAMEIFRKSGDLGLRVLNALADAIKKHPEINKLPTKEKYDKAILDLMLACLDKEVTKDDLKDRKTLDLYLELRNLRYRSIKYHLEKEVLSLDEKFVVKLANKINRDFVKKDKNNLEKDKQYVLSVTSAVIVANNHKSQVKRHKPIGPILKQIKKEYEKNNIITPHETKEEKILRILSKNEQKQKEESKSGDSPAKKSDSKSKKLSPAKKLQQKKLSAKKPAKSGAKKSAKKPAKAKVKSAGKKVKVASPKTTSKSNNKSKNTGNDKGKDKSKDNSKDKAKAKVKKKDDSDEIRRKNTLFPRMFFFMKPPRFFPRPPVGLSAPPPPPPRFRFPPPPPPPHRPFHLSPSEYFHLHDGGPSSISRSIPQERTMPNISMAMGRGAMTDVTEMSMDKHFSSGRGSISVEKTETIKSVSNMSETFATTSATFAKQTTFTRGFIKTPIEPDMERVMPSTAPEGIIKDTTFGRHVPPINNGIGLDSMGRNIGEHTLNV